MERLNRGVNFLKERHNQMEMNRHPHKDGCTKSQKIERFDEQTVETLYTADFSRPEMGFRISYSTRCTECGAEDHSHRIRR